jgi:hypothetical protein
MGRRLASRALAVGSLAAGLAAALSAILSGLGARTAVVAQANAADATISTRSVAFGHSRVRVQSRPSGRTCFSVMRGTSTVARSCASRIRSDQIAVASSRYAVGGLAGANVRAVIVKLTRKGTVWATLHRGAFYAEVPKRHAARAVVKVLRDGSRRSFSVAR